MLYLVIKLNKGVFQCFKGTLEVTYTTPIRELAKSLIVKLSGCGYVPEVELIQPKFNESLATYSIVFNALLIGHQSRKDIEFKNVGEIDCTVILEICNDFEGAFALLPKVETVKLLCIWDTERKNCTLCVRYCEVNI